MFLQHPEHHTSSPEGPDDGTTERKRLSLMSIIRAVLGWTIFYEQLVYSREKGDLKAWERFRDDLMRRWLKNLIVTCGLVIGIVPAKAYMDFPLANVPFTLGIISLFSSLVSVSFAVGMSCVLGDVQGAALRMMDQRHPNLYLFALSIPEIWTFISFGSFFTGVNVIVWQSVAAKGWVAKAGVIVSAIALLAHITALTFLFREKNTAKFLIDEMDVSDESPRSARQSGRVEDGKAFLGSDGEVSQAFVGGITQASFSHLRVPLRTKKAPESM